MNDEDWGAIAQRIRFAWPQQLTDQALATYRQSLDGLGAIAVMGAIDAFIAENRDSAPTPAAIRARAGATAPVTPPPAASIPAAPPPAPAPTGAGPIPIVASAGAGRPGGPVRKAMSVYLTALAAAVVFISCLMPWISSPFLSISGASTDDGKIVMVLSGLGVAAILLSYARVAFAVIGAILGLACAGTTLYHLVDIESRISDEDLTGFVSAGAGLWVGLFAGVAWAICAVASAVGPAEANANTNTGAGAPTAR